MPLPKGALFKDLGGQFADLYAQLRKATAGLEFRVREDYWPMIEPRVRPVRKAIATLTPVGRGVLLIALIAWLIAHLYGWRELAVVAAGGLILVAIAALFMMGHTDVSVKVTVEPVRVTVGEAVAGEVAVTNRARTPLLPLNVEVPVGEGGVTFMVPTLLSGNSHDELFVVPTERRGVIPVGPVTTVRGDALGLFRRDVRWTDITEIFVHPKITPLEPLSSGLLHDLEGRTSEAASPSDLAFHALREYVPGDDLRHVHWKSTARHGKLLIRQYLDTRRAHLCIVLDTRSEMYRDEEDFELAVSVAGSLLTRAILDGYDTSMVAGDQTMSRGNSRAALDICARVEPSERTLLSTALDASRLADDASLAVLITGGAANHLDIQRASTNFDHEVVKIGLRCDGGESAGLRAAGDFPFLTLSRLAELPGLLQWSA